MSSCCLLRNPTFEATDSQRHREASPLNGVSLFEREHAETGIVVHLKLELVAFKVS